MNRTHFFYLLLPLFLNTSYILSYSLPSPASSIPLIPYNREIFNKYNAGISWKHENATYALTFFADKALRGKPSVHISIIPKHRGISPSFYLLSTKSCRALINAINNGAWELPQSKKDVSLSALEQGLSPDRGDILKEVQHFFSHVNTVQTTSWPKKVQYTLTSSRNFSSIILDFGHHS